MRHMSEQHRQRGPGPQSIKPKRKPLAHACGTHGFSCGWPSLPHHAKHVLCAFHKRFEQGSAKGLIRLLAALALGIGHAKGQVLVAFGDIQRAKHPIPDRKDRPVVLVMVFDGNRVVNLVLRGRDQNMLHHPAIADPDVAVTEVRPKRMEQEIDGVSATDGNHA